MALDPRIDRATPIVIPENARENVEPLVQLIHANSSRAVTAQAVRMAMIIGYACGRDEHRVEGTYGGLKTDDWFSRSGSRP